MCTVNKKGNFIVNNKAVSAQHRHHITYMRNNFKLLYYLVGADDECCNSQKGEVALTVPDLSK